MGHFKLGTRPAMAVLIRRDHAPIGQRGEGDRGTYMVFHLRSVDTRDQPIVAWVMPFLAMLLATHPAVGNVPSRHATAVQTRMAVGHGGWATAAKREAGGAS
jgi:hypothetical protein